MVVYDDGVRYRRRQLAAHGDRATVLLFARDRVARALREVGRREPPWSLAPALPASLYLAQRRLRARLELARDDPGDRRDLEREALDLLRRTLAAESSTGAAVQLPGYVTRTLALLNERHAQPLRLVDLGREVGVTPPHLCRAFRRALGSTVHGYLVEIRLRAAIDLLFDTRLPLAEVALAAGFSHQSHLTETLRKATDTTPGHLRRELRGG